MTEDNTGDNVYALSCNEAVSRYEHQRDELYNLRDTALKTFRVSVLLLAVLVAFADAFREIVIAFVNQPLHGTPVELVSGIVVAGGTTLFVASPFISLVVMDGAHFTEPLGATDLKRISTHGWSQIVGEEFGDEKQGKSVWYQYKLRKYSSVIESNEETLDLAAQRLKWSHRFLWAGPLIILSGLWIKMVYGP